MHLLQLFTLTILASKYAVSVPTESGFRLSPRDDCDVDGDVNKRAPCTQPVQCGVDTDPEGAHQYSVQTIKSAVAWAKRSFPDKEGQIDGFPKYYGKSDKSVRDALPPDCAGTDVTLYEFPIGTGFSFNGDKNYQGGNPGPDRIVLAEKNRSVPPSRTFCLVMTHRGLQENQFKFCPPTE